MTMNNQNSAEELLYQQQLGQALMELSGDPRFQIILDGYLNKELLSASYEFTSSDEAVVKSAHNRVLGCTLFKEWLETAKNNGENAVIQLEEE